MPTWQKKPSAPVAFNLAQEAVIAMTGDTSWSWMLGWLTLIGNQTFLTEPFCEFGPTPLPEFDNGDFLSGMGPNPISGGLELGLLAAKIAAAASNRVFNVLCESVATVGWGEETCQSVGPRGGGGLGYTEITLPVPPGATSFRVRNTAREIIPTAGDDTVDTIQFYRYTASAYVDMVASFNRDTPRPSSWLTCTVSAGGHIDLRYYEMHNVMTLCWEWENEAGAEYEPIAPEQPDAAIPPASNAYTTIAELGAELDRQEFKLDRLLASTNYLAGTVPVLTAGGVDEPIEVDDGEEVLIGDAIGVIVECGAVPPWADQHFGNPPRIHHVGYASLGTDDAWLPPVDISTPKMLIAPIPAGITRVTVSTNPPTSATISLIHPPK